MSLPIPGLPEQLVAFAHRIGRLRSRAADPQRDAYTVVLGQMVQCNLIERSLYDELMAIPRTGVPKPPPKMRHG